MFTPDTAKTATIAEAVDTKCADLTEAQRATIKAKFAALGFGDSAGSYSVGLIIDSWREKEPDTYRVPPSIEQTTAALVADRVAKLGSCDGMQRININRRVAKMTADERLEATKGLKIEAPAIMKAETSRRATGAVATDDDVDAELARRRGMSLQVFRANTSPSKVLALRKHLKKETPARTTGAGNVNPHDPAFLALSPTERIKRFRAAGNR